MDASRVVSLLPSSTEIVCALGCGDRLVARSHECDFPASVTDLPICTAPRFEAEGSSAEIDDRVKQLVREGLSIYLVDPEVLRSVEPDVILTQDQCEVCAASSKDVAAAVASWVGGAPRVVSLSPQSLGDVWGDILRAASALGIPERGALLRQQLEDRVAAVERCIPAAAPRPTLACIEWLDPLMAAGNWLPELVERAGGRPLHASAGDHSPWLEWDALAADDPDVIVLLPCGFDIARTRQELPLLTRRPGWSELAAVRSGRVFLADGNQYFNRPGPRLVESLEILAEILHPESCDFGHAGRGYEPV